MKNKEFSSLQNNLHRIISKERAKEIAAHWHSGQWSALYSFASTGEIHIKKSLQYINELIKECQSEYHTAMPEYRSERDKKELKSLIRYFLKHLPSIEFVEHPVYRYAYPQLSDKNGIEVFETVDGIRLPV